jgi:hypothetical protein
MLKSVVTQTPDADTGNQVGGNFYTSGLWDVQAVLARLQICRRSLSNLLKKGLPHVKLGKRILFHPASVEAWLLRQQRGNL